MTDWRGTAPGLREDPQTWPHGSLRDWSLCDWTFAKTFFHVIGGATMRTTPTRPPCRRFCKVLAGEHF